MLWNSFKPTMLSDLWANAATGSASKDINRLKMDRQKDALGDMEQGEDLDRRNMADMGRRSAIADEKSTAPIEGESGPQRMTRLQNQAWDTDSYGDKYRSQFKQQLQPQSGQDGTDDEMELRRRRRMAQAGSEY